MRFLPILLRLLLGLGPALGSSLRGADFVPGPFFEAEQPFFHSKVELAPRAPGTATPGNLVVRGVVIPLRSGHAVVFDQDLLRLAAIWTVPEGSPPITLMTMAQISYANPRSKVGGNHPRPTGDLLVSTALHPGVGSTVAELFDDPRPDFGPNEAGRGALPSERGQFLGTEAAGDQAVLQYRVGHTRVREWYTSRGVGETARVVRHVEVQPHEAPVYLSLGRGPTDWQLAPAEPQVARRGALTVQVVGSGVTLSVARGELVATLPATRAVQRVAVAFTWAEAHPLEATSEAPAPTADGPARWPGSVRAPVELDAAAHNGLVLDRIAVPTENPWRRRVRAADLAFLDADRAAVVTYDGDVWLVRGWAASPLRELEWRRFASGLHESLALVVVDGVIQVATKNGVVRLHDRDGNGDADWYENFNDAQFQSQTTRSFPLDMALGPDGATYLAQGGIVSRSGIGSGGDGNPHTGAIVRISRDGRRLETLAQGAREPFVAVHPQTGVVTSTDQQGNYIPSSVAYLVRPGDNFGFLQDNPERLAPPLAWLPHEQDSSSSSQLWLVGEGLRPFAGQLLHLSYGTGRLFLLSPDLDAPVPQAAVIPLELRTELPLLHARRGPGGDAVYVAGFQIWGTRVGTDWALGRIRRGNTPVVTAVAARSGADGVILDFAAPLDPATVQQARVAARAWNYRRSSAYGSGRYTLAGVPGTTPWAVGQVALARDGRRVFVHLPELGPVHQLEVRHDFALTDGTAARGVVFFTIHAPRPLDLGAAGFPDLDLLRSVAVITAESGEPPSAALGKVLANNFGCIACHSIDGTTEGKVGPTWRNLYGARRTFIDGGSEAADELYLRDKILDPQQKKSKPGPVEMPSYRGVLDEEQIEALVLYIKSLAGRRQE